MSVKLTKNFKASKAQLGKSTAKAVTDATLFVLGDAVGRTPVDTGDLRGSGSTDIDVTESRVEGVVGYSAPYAVRVHEDMSMFHPRGGEAKFLENAFTQNEKKIEQHIQDAIKGGME